MIQGMDNTNIPCRMYLFNTLEEVAFKRKNWTEETFRKTLTMERWMMRISTVLWRLEEMGINLASRITRREKICWTYIVKEGGGGEGDTGSMNGGENRQGISQILDWILLFTNQNNTPGKNRQVASIIDSRGIFEKTKNYFCKCIFVMHFYVLLIFSFHSHKNAWII